MSARCCRKIYSYSEYAHDGQRIERVEALDTKKDNHGRMQSVQYKAVMQMDES